MLYSYYVKGRNILFDDYFQDPLYESIDYQYNILYGYYEVVKLLVDNGANVCSGHCKALRFAALDQVV